MCNTEQCQFYFVMNIELNRFVIDSLRSYYKYKCIHVFVRCFITITVINVKTGNSHN